MGKMYFIPGMKPGHVSGAAGASGPRRAEKLVSGPAYRGVATPKNLVPYQQVTPKDNSAEKRERLAKDVAEAATFHRDSPTSAKEKLREVRGAAAEVAV